MFKSLLVWRPWITDAKAVEIAQAAVAEHTPLILKELGLDQENDGILDRIHVSPEFTRAGRHGLFESKSMVSLFSMETSYVEGSGTITIWPLNMRKRMIEFYKSTLIIRGFTKPDKVLIKPRYKMLFNTEAIRKAVIVTLAHELRHYYQRYRNTHKIGRFDFLFQEARYDTDPIEVDAREFADYYLNKVYGGAAK